MLPAITKIVLVQHRYPGSDEVVGDRNLPAWQDSAVTLLIGKSNLDGPFAFGLRKVEGVKMVVEPTHGILDRYVKVPERILLWHLYTPPNRGRDPAQRHLVLMNHRRMMLGIVP